MFRAARKAQGTHTPPTKNVRRRPTLPHPPECSTIGAVELSYRVRNGNRAFPRRYDRRNTTRPTSPPTPPTRGARELLPENHTVNANTQTNNNVLNKPSAISTSQLHTLLRFHTWPINPVISWGPPTQSARISHLEAGFPLRCFQRLSLPDVANQPCPWQNNWHTRGQSIPVLSY